MQVSQGVGIVHGGVSCLRRECGHMKAQRENGYCGGIIFSKERDRVPSAAVYRPRNPQLSDYYRCVEDYFETFVRVYDEHFSRQYGFWRPYVKRVIHRYLDCGDLHNGFARVKYGDCGY